MSCRARPPGVAFFSSRVTRCPAFARKDAADKPAKPLPITIRFLEEAKGNVLVTDDLLFQEFAGEVNAALDGSEGFGEHVGDLVVFIAIKIQQKGRFEDLGEIADRSLYLLHIDIMLGLVGYGGGAVDQKFVGCIVEDGTLLGFAAVVVDEDVPHDGEQPGFDVGAYVVLLAIGKCLVQGFLVEVVSGLAVTRKVDGKGLQEVGIGKEQIVEFKR